MSDIDLDKISDNFKIKKFHELLVLVRDIKTCYQLIIDKDGNPLESKDELNRKWSAISAIVDNEWGEYDNEKSRFKVKV